MAALNLWLHGSELAIISRFGNNSELGRKAEIFFRRAVLLDSTFAEAYVSLGWRQFVRRNYDSTLYFAERALHFDPEFAEGYSFKGFICNILGLDEEAENAFALALKLDPDETSTISLMGDLQFDKGEYAKSLELYLKALQLANEPFDKSGILRGICSILYTNGLYEEGLQFAEKIIETNGDSLYYIMGLITSAISRNDYSSAYRKAMESFRWNPRDNYASWRSIGMYLTRDCYAALTFVDECIATIEKQGTRVQPRYYFGYVYLKNGQKEKSDYHFEGAINHETKILEREQPLSSCRASISLACIYSAMDHKAKSLEYLRKAIQYKEEYIAISPLLITELKNHPMFNNIRNEPEFQKLIKIAEEKWISERRKIKKLMQEKGISD